MAFVVAGEVTRGDGVDEREKACFRSPGGVELGKELCPFVLQHGLQTRPRNVARAGAVEIVANFLVVGGDGFRDGAGGAAYLKKPAGDFLASADFREGSEDARVEIDGEGLLVSVEWFGGVWHGFAPMVLDYGTVVRE